MIVWCLVLFLFQRTILMKLLYYDDVTVRSFQCFLIIQFSIRKLVMQL